MKKKFSLISIYFLLIVLTLSQSSFSVQGDRFIHNKNGTILDKKTGLIWQKAASAKNLNWHQAREYAGKLTLAGYRWRLPKINELIALFQGHLLSDVEKGAVPPYQWLSIQGFVNISPLFLWASEDIDDNKGYAWGIDTKKGYPYDHYGKVQLGGVLCVKSEAKK